MGRLDSLCKDLEKRIEVWEEIVGTIDEVLWNELE